MNKIKLSELLEKLYTGEYLTDTEYELYWNIVNDLKKKEKKGESVYVQTRN